MMICLLLRLGLGICCKGVAHSRFAQRHDCTLWCSVFCMWCDDQIKTPKVTPRAFDDFRYTPSYSSKKLSFVALYGGQSKRVRRSVVKRRLGERLGWRLKKKVQQWAGVRGVAIPHTAEQESTAARTHMFTWTIVRVVRATSVLQHSREHESSHSTQQQSAVRRSKIAVPMTRRTPDTKTRNHGQMGRRRDCQVDSPVPPWERTWSLLPTAQSSRGRERQTTTDSNDWVRCTSNDSSG